jgi:hypothetical protein
VKHLILLLAMILLPVGGYAQTAIVGTNLTWSLSGDTLTIGGTGAMPDRKTYDFPPWGSCRDEITSVMIGSGVTGIEGGTFAGYGSLTSMEVETGNPSYSSVDGVLFNSDKTVLLCCPGGKTGNYDIPPGVTGIGKMAFGGCSGLTSVTLPYGVTDIGDMSFGGCSGLTSVTVPYSVTGIGDMAFAGCSDLTYVSIPPGVTRIGEVVFYDCRSLTSASIPHNVISMGEGAFAECHGLTSVTLPRSLTRMEAHVFYNCCHLKHVTVEWPEPLSIPNNVFDGVPLESVTLYVPAGTKSLYEAAGGWKQFGTIVEPPVGLVTAIEGTDLTWSFFDGTLTVGGNGEMPYHADHLPPWHDESDKIGFVIIGNGVTGMGEAVFRNCRSLTSVSIPSGMTGIGVGTFYGCSSLLSVFIPPGVKRIGAGAFYGCSSLTAVSLPDSLTDMGEWAFYSCHSLMSVSIPRGITHIEGRAFYDCRSLTSVSLPGSVTRIGVEAFAECHSLTSVSLPDSVTDMGEGAFAGCRSLTSVSLPRSLTRMEAYAFYNCRHLKHVTVGWPEPLSIPNDVFKKVPLKSVTLHVPAGTKPLYEASKDWKRFGTITEQ